ncbi:hypothetical protein WKH25_03790 [Pantoea agglomerans]|uniref:hypothetical protein n=1 Tax=Enterobacter agglomerans TaxID=549 RepID=UPI003C7E4454
MIRWFYCAEIYKDGYYSHKVSGVFPEFDDHTLAEISGSNDAKSAYDSIVWKYQMQDPSLTIVITAFNQV